MLGGSQRWRVDSSGFPGAADDLNGYFRIFVYDVKLL